MPASRLDSDIASKTAELAAVARAYHTLHESSQLFRDELAISMCGPVWRTILSSRILIWFVTRVLMRRVMPIVPIIYTRARFGEDCLEAALEDGVTQLVIVGAGYDTFAFRRPDLSEKLVVYELDHPATQEMKFRRMMAAGISKPANARYVKCDLAAETVLNALGRTDFDAAKPAVFSWFGVAYYLDEATVQRTLSDLANGSAAGSSVVFDYLAATDSVAPEFRKLRKNVTEFVARRGEPMLSDINPENVPDFLRKLGFSEIDNLEPGRVSERYPDDRLDLKFPPIFGLCRTGLAG